MGARLAAYYTEAEAIAGLDGKIQLAMLTRIPSTRALVEPDSSDNVAKFDAAMNTLRRSRGSQPMSMPAGALFSDRVSGTHRALSGGEELFWGVLGSLHDAMVAVYEASGHCALAWESRSLERRYPSTDPTQTVRETVAREIGLRFAGELRTVFEAATHFQGEAELDVHGHQAWFSITLTAGHDQTGRVLGVNAFIQDISEQKRHELLLVESEKRLREQTRVYVELVARKSALLVDVGSTVRQVTEALTSTLGVARASVWFYDADKAAILCEDLFLRESGEHGGGSKLSAEQFPPYFAALLEERTIAAHDAGGDPRTACFAESYLAPLGITSMLDVPIWVGGEMVGVLCNEHVGEPRTWTPDEENFAYLLASFVALALEREQLKCGQ
jgi:GAF domain-containing protein